MDWNIKSQLRWIRLKTEIAKASGKTKKRRCDPDIAKAFANESASPQRASSTEVQPPVAPVETSRVDVSVGDDAFGPHAPVFMPFAFPGGQPELIWHFTDSLDHAQPQESIQWGYDELPSDCAFP